MLHSISILFPILSYYIQNRHILAPYFFGFYEICRLALTYEVNITFTHTVSMTLLQLIFSGSAIFTLLVVTSCCFVLGSTNSSDSAFIDFFPQLRDAITPSWIHESLGFPKKEPIAIYKKEAEIIVDFIKKDQAKVTLSLKSEPLEGPKGQSTLAYLFLGLFGVCVAISTVIIFGTIL